MQAMQVDSVFAEHFRLWLVAITSFQVCRNFGPLKRGSSMGSRAPCAASVWSGHRQSTRRDLLWWKWEDFEWTWTSYCTAIILAADVNQQCYSFMLQLAAWWSWGMSCSTRAWWCWISVNGLHLEVSSSIHHFKLCVLNVNDRYVLNNVRALLAAEQVLCLSTISLPTFAELYS